MILISTLILLAAAAGCKAHARTTSIDRTTVNPFDLKRYMGRWYEIARYDHRFERNLEQCEAFYTLLPDNHVSVTNSGVDIKNDKKKTTYGKAKLGKQVGQLRVSFFLFFYSDYNVLALDKNYNWALVGSKSSKYLWILSRMPYMDDATYSHITDIAQERGYDISKLIRVNQQKSPVEHNKTDRQTL